MVLKYRNGAWMTLPCVVDQCEEGTGGGIFKICRNVPVNPQSIVGKGLEPRSGDEGEGEGDVAW